MSGTFSSLSTALSALKYQRVAMDVASGNVANSGNAGYARRQVVGQATGAPAMPAIWSRWEGAGDGVEASRVDRMVDPLLDARSRAEHSSLSFLDSRATSLARLESSIGEPGDDGVAAALAEFKKAWSAVANSPDNSAARSQLVARAETLRSTIATQGSAVSNEWADQRTRLDALAVETTQVASELADLNRGLRASHVAGTEAGTLLDQRDRLALRLSELTGATVTINTDTTVDVQVSGQQLVSGNTAYAVTVSGAESIYDQGADPVTLRIDGNPVTLGGGQLGGTAHLLSTDLPDYLTKLDDFVASMATAVNDQHALGVDLDGNPGGPVFTGTTAATLAVALTDARAIAAADPVKGGLDNTNALKLGTLDMASGDYRNLVTRFGVTVASARQAFSTQGVLVGQVDASREALSGINVDEEMVNLLAAQRGYEGAARVLTAMDTMLDTLINRTGLVGR
jgi:flagellar hook-associated protein 1